MQLTCTQLRHETRDTTTYWFETNQPLDFIPGQFLPIEITIKGQSHHRCYSLSSIPGDRHCALTIKRVNAGLVSNYLLDNFKVGDRLRSGDANGDFHLGLTGNEPLLMLSAGCGITPVYSMLRSCLLAKPDTDIMFIHSARTPQDLIFSKELETLARQHPNLTLCWAISQNDQPNQYQGKLDANKLHSLVPDIHQRTILMCGPQGYMDAAKTWFNILNVNPEKVFHEQYHAMPAPSTEQQNIGNHQLNVNGKEVSIKKGQTVLDALENEGVPIFAACRAGVCGSCKCQGESDRIERMTTGVLTQEELEQGYFLACASHVNGDMSMTTG